jgi:hypothetical protein
VPQLSVTPADLAAAASVLRGVAAGLDDALGMFAGVAARCCPELGAGAAAAAEAAAAAARRSAAVVAADVTTAGRGLVAIAAAYSDIDRHLLGGAP